MGLPSAMWRSFSATSLLCLRLSKGSRAGRRVETVQTENLEETLGINDQSHLQFAERLRDIAYAESLYELVDVVVGAATCYPPWLWR